MRFTWKGRGEGSPSRPAFLAGLLGTLVKLAAIALSVSPSVAGLGERMVSRVRATYESLTFVTTDRARDPARLLLGGTRPGPGTERTASPVRGTTSATSAPEADRARSDDPLNGPDPRLVPAAERGYRAELRLPEFSVTRELTASQRDSTLGVMAGSVAELAKHMKPTQEQRDSTQREIARRFAEARDQHRPVAMPMGGGIAVPVGILGGNGYRTKEQRRQDSIVHQGNLRRLAVLAERARVRLRQDSMRRADSIASLRTQKGDSTDD